MSLVCTRMSIDSIATAQKEAMHDLMCRYYLGVQRQTFLDDLHEKDCVLTLIDEAPERIVGFSTLVRLTISVAGERVVLVFSGDTIVEEAYRRSGQMGRQLMRYWEETIALWPNTNSYYVLISKGWRTYRLLPFFFKRFWPHPQHSALPNEVRSVRNVFGTTLYPERYRVDAGVITGNGWGQRIRSDSPESMTAAPADDPFVRYFAIANPCHENGDELICLARLSSGNYAPGALRLLGSRREGLRSCTS